MKKKELIQENIQFTLFSISNEQEPERPKPVFFSKNDIYDGYSEYNSNGRKVLTFNAENLIDMLDNEELDCIVVAGDLMKDKIGYQHIARIMSTSNGGCSLLINTFRGIPEEFDASNKLQDWIKATFQEERQVLQKYLFDNNEVELNQFYKELVFKEIDYKRKNERSGDFLRICDEYFGKARGQYINFEFNNFFKSLESNIDAEKYKRLIHSFTKNLYGLRLLLSERTIAKQHYEQFMYDIHFQEIVLHDLNISESSTWDDEIANIVFPFVYKSTKEICVDVRRTVLFLCWEPIITHFKRKVVQVCGKPLLNKSINSKSVDITREYSATSISSELFFTFDLISKRIVDTNKSAVYRTEFISFLSGLRDCIVEIKNSITILSNEEKSAIKSKRNIETEMQNICKEIDTLNSDIRNMETEDERFKKILKSNRDAAKNKYENHKETIADINLRLKNRITGNEVIKTLKDAFDIHPSDCFDSIKMLHFDLECDLEWVLNIIKKNN